MLDGIEGAAPSRSPPSSTIRISRPAATAADHSARTAARWAAPNLASSARSVPLSVGITGASYGSPTQDLGVLECPPFVGVGRTAGLC